MTKTEHYQLNQWDAADPIRREDFNADNARIDAALAGKVERTDLEALGRTVEALTADLGFGGKTARIAWGSYTGNGKCGAAHPNTLTFDFQPKVVFVARTTVAYGPVLMVTGGVSTGYCQMTWTGNSVNWYDNRGDYATSTEQLNDFGVVYSYVAVGC